MAATEAAGTLAGAGDSRTTAHAACCATRVPGADRLQFGQVLLATVGSTAPLSGLLGTVWGHLPRADQHQRAGPDHHRQGFRPGGRGADHDGRRAGGGHSAVLAYNVLGLISRLEADLEGFARA